MNKPNLEVVRFENEDVIATSSSSVVPNLFTVAGLNDTTLKNLVITINGVEYKLSNYERHTEYTNAVNGALNTYYGLSGEADDKEFSNGATTGSLDFLVARDSIGYSMAFDGSWQYSAINSIFIRQ